MFGDECRHDVTVEEGCDGEAKAEVARTGSATRNDQGIGAIQPQHVGDRHGSSLMHRAITPVRLARSAGAGPGNIRSG